MVSRENFDNSSILIQDIMTKVLITVNSTTTALQIAKMMDQGGIGAIFVKENNHPVGVVTDRDFAIKIAANNLPFGIPAEK